MKYCNILLFLTLNLLVLSCGNISDTPNLIQFEENELVLDISSQEYLEGQYILKVLSKIDDTYHIRFLNLDHQLLFQYNSPDKIINGFVYPSNIIHESYALITTTKRIVRVDKKQETSVVLQSSYEFQNSDHFKDQDGWHFIYQDKRDSLSSEYGIVRLGKYENINAEKFQVLGKEEVISGEAILLNSLDDIQVILNSRASNSISRFSKNESGDWQSSKPVNQPKNGGIFSYLSNLELNGNDKDEIIFSIDQSSIGIYNDDIDDIVANFPIDTFFIDGAFYKEEFEGTLGYNIMSLLKINNQSLLFSSINLLNGQVVKNEILDGKFENSRIYLFDLDYDDENEVIIYIDGKYFIYNKMTLNIEEFEYLNNFGFSKSILVESSRKNNILISGISKKSASQYLNTLETQYINLGLNN